MPVEAADWTTVRASSRKLGAGRVRATQLGERGAGAASCARVGRCPHSFPLCISGHGDRCPEAMPGRCERIVRGPRVEGRQWHAGQGVALAVRGAGA